MKSLFPSVRGLSQNPFHASLHFRTAVPPLVTGVLEAEAEAVGGDSGFQSTVRLTLRYMPSVDVTTGARALIQRAKHCREELEKSETDTYSTNTMT